MGGIYKCDESLPRSNQRFGKKLEWAVLKYLLWGEADPLPYKMRKKFERIWIAQQFPGWTLEYIDSLSYADKQSIMAVVSAQTQHRHHLRKSK